jgi:hypothetical protein
VTNIFNNAKVWWWTKWVLIPLALVYGWYQFNYPTATFRYKLIAEVMTPDGVKTGSSVIEVSYRNGPSISGVVGLDLSARGEAVFVPLDDKRMFVVTLTGNSAGRPIVPTRSGEGPGKFRSYGDEPKHLRGALDIHALPLRVLNVGWFYDERRLLKQIELRRSENRRFPVAHESLPTLVVFDDIANPDSVRVVQPDTLDQDIGPGFALQNVWLEMTDERPTNTGMTAFPWWKEKSDEQKTLHALGKGVSLINNIFDEAFRRPGIWENNQ